MRTIVWIAAAAASGLAARAWVRSRRRLSFEGASVVITGGSRGLGLELARCFAREGARLTLLARDPDELERARHELAAAGADVQVYACDVGDAAAVERAVRFVDATHGGIRVLVNTAGIIQVGPVAHMTPDDFTEALDVHTWGPLHTMHAVVPVMKRQGGGRIVNISSIGGLVAVPHLLPYTVSKFALTGLSDGMRAELAASGIHVVTVCPGLMRTGSHVHAWFKGRHEHEFAWFATASSSPLLTINAHRAARQIVEACRYGKARLILTPQARLLHATNAFLPGLTAQLMKLTARALPAPNGAEGTHRRKGWASRSETLPAPLTRLADRAAVRNNELPG